MSDEFTTDDIIYTQNARERMAEIACPEIEIDTPGYEAWSDEHGDEYRLILDFRMGVIGAFGLSFWDTDTNLSFVSARYFADYAQNRAEDIYTGADTEYWDKQKWQDDERATMISFLVGDEEYWGDGER